MGVYIKGMDMPKNCKDCEFVFSTISSIDLRNRATDTYSRFSSATKPVPYDIEIRIVFQCKKTLNDVTQFVHLCKRADDCPLIEVQKHGRMIDADKLMELAQNCISKSVDCNDIARFPTVIESED